MVQRLSDNGTGIWTLDAHPNLHVRVVQPNVAISTCDGPLVTRKFRSWSDGISGRRGMLQLQVTRSHYPPDHWQDLKNGGGSQGLVTEFGRCNMSPEA